MSVAHDDIYSTKVRVEVELGEGFRIAPLFSEKIISRAFDAYGAGRHWKIRYDERAHGLIYTPQLTGHNDFLVEIPSGIDVTSDYSVSILDVWDDEETLTETKQIQKRIVILMPVTITCGTGATGNTIANDQPATLADLNAILGYWLDSARSFNNFSINMDDGVAAPDGSGDPTGVQLGTGVYFV